MLEFIEMIEKNKTIYDKHQYTTDMLHYRAVSPGQSYYLDHSKNT